MNLDRFSQPMPWEGRDYERERDIEEERGDHQLDIERSEPEPTTKPDGNITMKSGLLLLAVCLTGCDDLSKKETSLEPVEYRANTNRFTLERVSVVRDVESYNNRRSIYILKDHVTGVDYIGVSGIGITESARVGKVIVEQ